MNFELIKRLLPATIRPRRIVSGPLRGRRIATSWRIYPRAILGIAELPLLAWLRQHVRPGETWLDVGAHHGYTSIALSQLATPSGRVFAFEAVPRTAGRLVETKLANEFSQLIVVPLALGNVEEMQRIEICPTSSSMATYGDSGEGLTESIYVQSLDRLWPQICNGEPAIHGVKIDVQGWEIEVLLGMRNLLKKYRPKIALEVHAGVDRQQLLEVLADANYDCRPVLIDSSEACDPPDQMLDNTTYAFLPLAGEGIRTVREAA